MSTEFNKKVYNMFLMFLLLHISFGNSVVVAVIRISTSRLGWKMEVEKWIKSKLKGILSNNNNGIKRANNLTLIKNNFYWYFCSSLDVDKRSRILWSDRWSKNVWRTPGTKWGSQSNKSPAFQEILVSRKHLIPPMKLVKIRNIDLNEILKLKRNVNLNNI